MLPQFLLSVTHLQDNEYLIRTEKVEPCVPLAEERKFWDVDQWLNQAQTLMNDSVLSVLKNHNRQSKSPLLIPKQAQFNEENSQQSLINLGQTLYDALFFGTIRDSWLTAQSLAQSQKMILRFRLALKHEPLLSLPWEVLHPSATDSFRFIVTGTEVAFSRYHPYRLTKNANLIVSPVPYDPLKILIVISSPDDQEKLALKQEVQHLQAELKIKSSPDARDIVFKVLENPGREELTQALEQEHYQVFHYAGHSNIGGAGGDIYLVNHRTGLTESLSGEDLAGLLENNKISMAVFNSCRSGDTGFGENLQTGTDVNLAQAVVKRGIPAVLAMVAPIPDQVALTFSRLVYRNINLGYPIDVSLSRARQGLLSAYGSNQLYWALPVLYLHPDFDGILIKGDESNNRDPAWYTKFETDESSLNSDISPNPPKVISASENPITPSDEMIVKSILEDLKEKDKINNEAKDTLNAQYSVENITPLKPLKIWKFKQLSRKIRLITFGGVAIITLITGLWWYLKGQTSSQSVSNSSNNTTKPLNLDDVNTANVTAIAIEKFSQGNLAQGSLAVEKLLDQGLVSYAESALIQVDPTQLNDPEINFLFGRLAWQSYWSENDDYSLDDARRYWETAIKENPDQIKYYNALGFAYYAENDFERANNSWFKALELINLNPTNTLDLNSLNTYAGLALGLKKSAQNYQGKQRQDLINQSLSFREKVVKNNAIKFQSEVLGKPENWIWFETAIKDWESFLEVDSSEK